MYFLRYVFDLSNVLSHDELVSQSRYRNASRRLRTTGLRYESSKQKFFIFRKQTNKQVNDVATILSIISQVTKPLLLFAKKHLFKISIYLFNSICFFLKMEKNRSESLRKKTTFVIFSTFASRQTFLRLFEEKQKKRFKVKSTSKNSLQLMSIGKKFARIFFTSKVSFFSKIRIKVGWWLSSSNQIRNIHVWRNLVGSSWVGSEWVASATEFKVSVFEATEFKVAKLGVTKFKKISQVKSGKLS